MELPAHTETRRRHADKRVASLLTSTLLANPKIGIEYPTGVPHQTACINDHYAEISLQIARREISS